MNIREISTARLREYENNPRNNDLAVEKVKYSIERFGFLFPVIIDQNYVIVCGHTRVRACRELGIQSVPCIIADELTDEQINLFRLVDNKSSEYSDWDFEKLKSELSLVDLTLDENQLLLDRFELSAEVFDIDAEQAEIKIPSFNFMGVNDNRPKEKKPVVRTFSSDDEVVPSDTPEATIYAGQGEAKPASAFTAEATPEGMNIETSEPTPGAPEKKESKAIRAFCQFRFGDVSFFISQVELDQLNEKYAEYIDTGALLEGSFANYLLKGVENND
ncbi:MAG: ParB N-terminal domain-containing protein [Bacteroides sp.]